MTNKKVLTALAGFGLLGALVAGCGGGTKAGDTSSAANQSTEATATEQASPSPSPSQTEAATETAEPTPSQEASASQPPTPSATTLGNVITDGSDRVCEAGGPSEAQCKAIVLQATTVTQGDSTIEQVTITDDGGFTHTDEINSQLEAFFLWPITSTESDGASYSIEAAYSIYNDRLSVRAYSVAVFPSAAHPTNSIYAQVFDLTTGQPIPFSEIYPKADSGDVRQALTDGTFKQIYPDPGTIIIDDGAELVAKAVIDQAPANDSNYYYAVEDGQVRLCLFANGAISHAEGDYLVFEGPVGD
ncbi:MAG: hypothetical protein LBR19_07850 [Bifidobacteriaceae bacterium]|jgi:hypothetical protein|nr:hypothetical protein [Bifidobacteriaceae bacterium]